MTIEQFRAEYHLLDRVSDGTVETYHAQAAAGVMVMVHFLRGTEGRNAAILDRIERIETERRQKVLRIIEVDGVTAVVTRFILDLTTFEDWLGADAAPADFVTPGTPPAEGSTLSEASATTPRPGEFTRLFTMPAEERAIPTSPGPGADLRFGPAGAVQMPQYDTDSYRERLAAPPSSASPLPPPPTAPPPPVLPTGPSEFTKVIESSPTPSLGPPPPSTAPPPPRPRPPPPSNKLLLPALLGVILAAIVFVVIFALLA